MSNRVTPEINAGSMADIAFLLLIFFLVTTTLDADVGILKKISHKDQKIDETQIHKNNAFEIAVNANNEIQIENSSTITIDQLRPYLVDFIDNGASTDNNNEECSWCNGKKDPTSSQHPSKAIISLEVSRGTSYSTYIMVHNEMLAAYTELRNKFAIKHHGISFEELIAAQKRVKDKTEISAKIKDIKDKYPIHIFDKEPLK